MKKNGYLMNYILGFMGIKDNICMNIWLGYRNIKDDNLMKRRLDFVKKINK